MPTVQPGVDEPFKSAPKALTGLHGDKSLVHSGVEVHQVVYCIIPLGDQSPKNDSVSKK
jgi:hypothetical protein